MLARNSLLARLAASAASLAFSSSAAACLALDGVTQRPSQQVALQRPLDQVILDALLHRLDGERLIVEAAEHDDGQLGHVGMHLAERLQAPAFRQR